MLSAPSPALKLLASAAGVPQEMPSAGTACADGCMSQILVYYRLSGCKIEQLEFGLTGYLPWQSLENRKLKPNEAVRVQIESRDHLVLGWDDRPVRAIDGVEESAEQA